MLGGMPRKPGLACHACNRSDFYTEASLKRHTAKFHTPGQKSPRGFRTRRDPGDDTSIVPQKFTNPKLMKQVIRILKRDGYREVSSDGFPDGGGNYWAVVMRKGSSVIFLKYDR